MTHYSIAQARDHFAQLINQAEVGEPVKITRQGKPIAIILSVQEYDQITKAKPSLRDVVKKLRHRIETEGIDLDPDEVFSDVRDQSPGRAVDI